MRWKTHRHGHLIGSYIRVHLIAYLNNMFQDQQKIITAKAIIYYIAVLYYKIEDISLSQMYKGDKIPTKTEDIEVVTHTGDTKMTLTITI